MATWYLYILECSDKSLYTGITVDLDRRVREHNEGKGAKYTRMKKPVHLVFNRTFPDRASASGEEFRIKKLSRAEKLALIVEHQGI